MTNYEWEATELLEAYRLGKETPEHVLDCVWQRIDKWNPSIHAIVTETRSASYAAARRSAERIRQHGMRPLEGIPIAIKDLTDTKDVRTTYGSLVFDQHIPTQDAEIVRRLKEAGAILIGKTNTPEFGHKATTNNRVFGATRNPWKLSNGVGGSSGGSAAAVAAGFCPLAEGSDGGGSIRIPSALCGVVGFKPSFGRIPLDNNKEDVFASTMPFVSYGPIARTVRDAALMFDAVQGPSADDPFSVDALDPPICTTLRDGPVHWRIGYTYDFGVYPLDDQIRCQFDKTLAQFCANGASVTSAPICIADDRKQYVQFFNRLWMIGLAESCVDLMRDHREALSPSLVSMILRGEHGTAAEYLALQQKRTAIWRLFQKQFERVDILVSPTLGAVQYGYDQEGPNEINGQPIDSESEWMMTSPINLTGEPACSLPIGRTAEGLPIGMQCIAPKLADRRLFQFAYWAEAQIGWQDQPLLDFPEK
ncbi:MAG: amidase [Sporolactobacillus sp.]